MAFTKVSAAGINTGGSVSLDDLTVYGNVSVAGTVTYENVTNVDSIGIITARSGIELTGGNVTLGTGTTISSPASNEFAISTNGTGRISINADGDINIDSGGVFYDATNNRVAVGTTSPGALLDVTGTNGKMLIANGASADSMRFSVQNATGTGNAAMVFESWNLEYGRFDTSGRLLVGTTSLNAYGTVNAYSNTAFPALRTVAGSSMALGSAVLAVDKHQNVNSTSQVFMVFTINDQGTGSGQINANGASQAAFGSFSDRRLKENIVDLPPQLDNVCKLRPVEFDYIESEGAGHQISFIAQEFEEVYPDAIGEREDGMKTLTGWGKTEAILVKALQEAVAKIKTLEANNLLLEARLAALETP